MSLAISSTVGNDSATGGRPSVPRVYNPSLIETPPVLSATIPQPTFPDPNDGTVFPPTTRPVATCETADAAIGQMKWWMGLAVVAVGVALGVLVSRRS